MHAALDRSRARAPSHVAAVNTCGTSHAAFPAMPCGGGHQYGQMSKLGTATPRRRHSRPYSLYTFIPAGVANEGRDGPKSCRRERDLSWTKLAIVAPSHNTMFLVLHLPRRPTASSDTCSAEGQALVLIRSRPYPCCPKLWEAFGGQLLWGVPKSKERLGRSFPSKSATGPSSLDERWCNGDIREQAGLGDRAPVRGTKCPPTSSGFRAASPRIDPTAVPN